MEQVEQLGQQVIRITPLRPGPARSGAAPAVRPDDFSPALKTRMLVLQPTPFCNIACRYCYLPNRDDVSRMTPTTAALAVQRLRDDGLLGDVLDIVWHAGEPLVLPAAWYDEAIAAMATAAGPRTRLQHALQTNATLIDDAWCELFARQHIAVGVSVDGPALLHDSQRRTRGGGGTHARVQRGIAALRARGVSFHAIAVVTAATLHDPTAFFDWFEDQGIHDLACNIDEAEGVHARSSLQGHEAAHAAFIAMALQRTLAGPLRVREIVQARQLLARPLPRWRWRDECHPDNSQVIPLALVTVRADGSWGTFSPELPGQRWPGFGDFLLGNVHHAGFVQALASPGFARLWADLRDGLRACARDCAHHAWCGGGAPANKLYEHGHLRGSQTLYCRSMLQRPFDAVLAHAEHRLGLAHSEHRLGLEHSEHRLGLVHAEHPLGLGSG